MGNPITHVPASSLSSLSTRISYLRSFISFSASDASVLHSSASVVAPLIPVIVDTVYEKLLSFDITAQSFVPRQTGYSGEAPTSLDELTPEHPQIRFRKDFLAGYLRKLVTMDYDKIESWEYLDKVGVMHTGRAGFAHRAKKPALRVELVHCALLLGYVEDILVGAVMGHPDLDNDTKTVLLRAVNKLLWIQNDLFARHYVADADAAEEAEAKKIMGRDRVALAAVAIGLVAAGAGLMHVLGPAVLWQT
ncbi:Protoglobin-domain-containing protein [Tricharina praecox]|uniref:Protoglobin-domain-containing protein n=1 Tax=Tricharina praecox TaxID=43433 RepID=UPI00221FE836|nr:Protoglobin-domain-containing protein [Tricharina praecox]KAI5856033.1 Protoglobin-domain-containing protein [Tricharina praecox]